MVGSDEVVEATDRFARLSTRFYADLFTTRIRQRSVPEDQPDRAAAIAARMALGKIADEMGVVTKDLEARIRREMPR